MSKEAWNLYADPNLQVITGSHKKATMLTLAGVMTEQDMSVRRLVNKAEDRYDTHNGNGVIVDGEQYAAQTVAHKLAYLRGREMSNTFGRYPYSLVVTDSVHYFRRQTPDGMQTKAVNKHGGQPHKVHKLLDFYHDFAAGAVIGTSTGLAQLHNNGQVNIYQVNVDFGYFDPFAVNMEEFAGDPNVSGGFSTQDAFKTQAIQMFDFVPFQVRRLDVTPDLHVTRNGGAIVSGSLISNRAFRSELAGDPVNYEMLAKLNLGIVT